MSERPKSVESLIKVGICPYLWVVHFLSKRPDKVKCGDCSDFKSKVCEGGKDPIECFKQQKPKIGDVLAMSSFGSFGFMEKEPRKEKMVCEGDCKRCEAFLSFVRMATGFGV